MIILRRGRVWRRTVREIERHLNITALDIYGLSEVMGGRGAILHGYALVGMNAVILDGAQIGENCIVGATIFVKAKVEFAAGQLILGSPAKAVRELHPDEIGWKKKGTHEYQDLVIRCQQTMDQVEPLRKGKANRHKLVFENRHVVN